MQTDKRIQILLSTYNGEEYLHEQLDSYLTLDGFEHCSVLIRDDGSTDSTREILQEYQKKFRFEVYFGKNIGVTNSYQWLLEHSNKDCDYFALSDQDDVWLSNKLKLACSFLDKEQEQLPLLFSSLSCITDEKLNPIGHSINPKKGVSFYNVMLQNPFPGHTQVLNRTLCKLLAENSIAEAHVVDWWISLIASGIGKLLFCPETTVLHRQHINNTVGYGTNIFSSIKKKLQYLFDGKGHEITKQLYSFYHQYSHQLPLEYRDELEKYIAGSGSFKNGIKYIVNHKTFRQKNSENILFSLLYLSGAYKLRGLDQK